MEPEAFPGRKTCRHWVPIENLCYICKKEQERPFTLRGRPEVFQNPSPTQGRPLQTHQMPGLQAPNGYRHPDDPRKKNYPMPITSVDPRRFMQTDRDNTYRSGYTRRTVETETGQRDMGIAMARALDTAQSLPPSGYHPGWGPQGEMDPMMNNRHEQPTVPQPMNVNAHAGLNTRSERKLGQGTDLQNMWLERSMVQPDMRFGNRFYEHLPQGTRKERSSTSNTRAQERQDASRVYENRDYSESFDRGAQVGRSTQPGRRIQQVTGWK